MTTRSEPNPPSVPSSAQELEPVPSAPAAAAAAEILLEGQRVEPGCQAAASACRPDGKADRFPRHCHRSHHNPPPARGRGEGRHPRQHQEGRRSRRGGQVKSQWNGRDTYRGRDVRGSNADDRAYGSQSRGRNHPYQNNSSSYRRHHQQDYSDQSRRLTRDYDMAGQSYNGPDYLSHPSRFAQNDHSTSENERMERAIKQAEQEARLEVALLEKERARQHRLQMQNHDHRLQDYVASTRPACQAFPAGDSGIPFATRDITLTNTQHPVARSFAARDTTVTTTQQPVARSFNAFLTTNQQPVDRSFPRVEATSATTLTAQPFATSNNTQPATRSFAAIASAAAMAQTAPAPPFAARDTTLATTQSLRADDDDNDDDEDDLNFSTTMDSSDDDTIVGTGTATRMRENAVRTAQTEDVVGLSKAMDSSGEESSSAAAENVARRAHSSTARPHSTRETTVSTGARRAQSSTARLHSARETAVNPDHFSTDAVFLDVSATIDSSDEDEQEPPTQRTPSPKRKKPRSRNSGRATLTRNMKMKLKEAQRADDEAMKHTLLLAWEEDMAALQSKGEKVHHHTEKDLMSTYTPKIVDHYLSAGGEVAKYLVEWNLSKRDLNNHKSCHSWVSQEEFLFPALARKYLEVKELGAAWIKQCVEREDCLNLLNTSSIDNDEYESHVEIDFCCYLCKCPWSHPMKNTLRNCENGLKFHRGCCHGYQDTDALDSFVSPVGQVLGQLYDSVEDEETTGVGELGNQMVERSDNIFNVVNGDSAMYYRCLNESASRSAVVLCLNAGVGSATVSLKSLGIHVGKMIHVEADRIAQHVFRSNHDIHYGETDIDDGIEHVVGLYESFHDIAGNPEEFVLRNGPIDIIICSSTRGESREESVQLASNFFELVNDIERLNKRHYQVDHLFFLLEVPSSIKHDLPSRDFSRCDCGHNTLICNWPISPQTTYPVSRLQLDDVFNPVSDLYDSLRSALFAGPFNKLWRDEVHPKYWVFLGLYAHGYDLKLEKKEFDYKAFLLRLRSPSSSNLLTAVDYSNYLMALAPSVPLLTTLLLPMKSLFGPRFDEMVHGHVLSESSGDVEIFDSPVANLDEEVEEIANDRETALFDQVEQSITL